MSNKLNKLREDLLKKYGQGTIIVGDENPVKSIPRWKIESIKISDLFGGGLPKGRQLEIFGAESSGKTSMTCYLMGQVQKAGGLCAFIDTEQSLDFEYAETFGVDMSKVWYSQPDNGEQALSILEDLAKSKELALIVIDSVAALVPQAEIEGEMGASHMAIQARLMGQAMRKITPLLKDKITSVIWINQVRCIDKNTLLNINGNLNYAYNLKKEDYIYNKKVLEVIDSNIIDGYDIFIKNKPNLRISKNHKQIILSSKGILEKKAKDLQVKDWLIQPIINDGLKKNIPYIDLQHIINESKKISYRKNIKLPTELNEDVACFLGMFYSDGAYLYHKQGTYGIQFGEKNKERFQLVLNLLIKLFGKEAIYTHKNQIFIYGKLIYYFVKKLGIKRYADNKDIPDLILQSKESVIKSFIKGCFFDTHGFSKKGFIFSNENNNSINKFSTLLYNMGIFADIITPRLNYKHKYLRITGTDAIKFNSSIGFLEQTKIKKASLFKESNNARGKFDVVPNFYASYIFSLIKPLTKKTIKKIKNYSSLNMCNYKHLNFGRKLLLEFIEDSGCSNHEKIINHYNLILNNKFTYITKIVNTKLDCIDIQVDQDNLYIADQFLTHNSNIGMYGPHTVTPGGNALKFYTSFRLEMKKKEIIQKGEDISGLISKTKVVKSKISTPNKVHDLVIKFGEGFDIYTEYLDYAVKYDIIKKSGAWYSYNDDKIGQGQHNAANYLKENSELYSEIKDKVIACMFPKKDVESNNEIEEDQVEEKEIEPKPIVKRRGRPKKE